MHKIAVFDAQVGVVVADGKKVYEMHQRKFARIFIRAGGTNTLVELARFRE
jgi:hypothetical protein